MLPDAYARGGDQQIAIQCPGEVTLQTLTCVRSDPQIDRLAPSLVNQSDQGVGVAAGDLSTTEDLLRLIHIDDLVTAPQNGHPGPPIHERMRYCQRSEDAQLRGPKLGPGSHDTGSLVNILAGKAEVDSNIPVVGDGDDVASSIGVFLADHTVAA